MREAKHELKQGSAGFLRSMEGWGVIALWALTILFCAAVLGDWQISGDFDGALDRSGQRLRWAFQIFSVLGGG